MNVSVRLHTVATDTVKPNVHLFATLDSNAKWSVEWYKLLDVDQLIPSMNISQQSVVPLMPAVGAIEFYSPNSRALLLCCSAVNHFDDAQRISLSRHVDVP